MLSIDLWKALVPPPNDLSDGQEWNVFLSYRSVNRPWVLNLYDVLREYGHRVFLDQCALKAGDRLIQALELGLTRSQAGVLVYSRASTDSKWVRKEYEAMEARASDDERFSFIPVRLDDSKLPLFAQGRVFLDFQAYPDGPNGGELLRLLFAIVGRTLSDEATRAASELDEASHQATASIKAAIKNGSKDRLLALFGQGGIPWEVSAGLGCMAAEGLTKLDHPQIAVDVLRELRERFPRAIRPKQLAAHAMSRRGEPDDLSSAQEILGELYESGERDPETLGMYGRTWMDRFQASGNIQDLKQSRDLYAEAFERAADDYYTGINVAAKTVLLGGKEELERAQDYAERVEQIVGSGPVPGDYWMTATVAEVLLIKGEFERAGKMYEQAVATARTEIGSHATTWMQARRLMEKLEPTGGQRAQVDNAFQHLKQND